MCLKIGLFQSRRLWIPDLAQLIVGRVGVSGFLNVCPCLSAMIFARQEATWV